MAKRKHHARTATGRFKKKGTHGKRRRRAKRSLLGKLFG